MSIEHLAACQVLGALWSGPQRTQRGGIPMPRRFNSDIVWPALAVLALASGAILAGCQQTPPALDLTTVATCPAEDGPGMTGPVPCVFDVTRKTDTANGYGGEVTRWYLYADKCPRTTVQDHRLVHCIGRADWTGGVEGNGRTN